MAEMEDDELLDALGYDVTVVLTPRTPGEAKTIEVALPSLLEGEIYSRSSPDLTSRQPK